MRVPFNLENGIPPDLNLSHLNFTQNWIRIKPPCGHIQNRKCLLCLRVISTKFARLAIMHSNKSEEHLQGSNSLEIPPIITSCQVNLRQKHTHTLTRTPNLPFTNNYTPGCIAFSLYLPLFLLHSILIFANLCRKRWLSTGPRRSLASAYCSSALLRTESWTICVAWSIYTCQECHFH